LYVLCFLHNYNVFKHASVMKPMHITSLVFILCVVMSYLVEDCNLTDKITSKTYIRVDTLLHVRTPTPTPDALVDSAHMHKMWLRHNQKHSAYSFPYAFTYTYTRNLKVPIHIPTVDCKVQLSVNRTCHIKWISKQASKNASKMQLTQVTLHRGPYDPERNVLLSDCLNGP